MDKFILQFLSFPLQTRRGQISKCSVQGPRFTKFRITQSTKCTIVLLLLVECCELVTDHAREEQYKVYVKSLLFMCVEHTPTVVPFVSET